MLKDKMIEQNKIINDLSREFLRKVIRNGHHNGVIIIDSKENKKEKERMKNDVYSNPKSFLKINSKEKRIPQLSTRDIEIVAKNITPKRERKVRFSFLSQEELRKEREARKALEAKEKKIKEEEKEKEEKEKEEEKEEKLNSTKFYESKKVLPNFEETLNFDESNMLSFDEVDKKGHFYKVNFKYHKKEEEFKFKSSILEVDSPQQSSNYKSIQIKQETKSVQNTIN